MPGVTEARGLALGCAAPSTARLGFSPIERSRPQEFPRGAGPRAAWAGLWDRSPPGGGARFSGSPATRRRLPAQPLARPALRSYKGRTPAARRAGIPKPLVSRPRGTSAASEGRRSHDPPPTQEAAAEGGGGSRPGPRRPGSRLGSRSRRSVPDPSLGPPGCSRQPWGSWGRAVRGAGGLSPGRAVSRARCVRGHPAPPKGASPTPNPPAFGPLRRPFLGTGSGLNIPHCVC